MVLVGTLSLVEGLRGGTDAALGRLQTAPYVYTEGTDLLSSRIDPASLAALSVPFEALRIQPGSLQVNGLDLTVTVAALESHAGGNVTTDYPAGSRDLSLDDGLVATIEDTSGAAVPAAGSLTVLGATFANLPIVDPPPARPAFLPDDWAWVRPGVLAAANPAEGESIQAIVVGSALDPGVVASLHLERFELVGAVGFFAGSVGQAETALASVVVVIAAVIGLLVYHALSLEILQRREEIRTLRRVGAAPRVVAAVYEGQGLLLAAVGATVGTGLGIVLAHAVVAFTPLAGLPNLVLLTAPVVPTAVAFATALGSSALAGLVPSRRAALLVRGGGEAVPS